MSYIRYTLKDLKYWNANISARASEPEPSLRPGSGSSFNFSSILTYVWLYLLHVLPSLEPPRNRTALKPRNITGFFTTGTYFFRGFCFIVFKEVASLDAAMAQGAHVVKVWTEIFLRFPLNPNQYCHGHLRPTLCKGLIDAVWCDNVCSQTHSSSANMLYLYTKEDMLCLDWFLVY